MNNKAIADALAARYTGITASSGTETQTLALCTARLPNTLPAGNALLVYPPTGEYTIGVSAIRQGTVGFFVRLLRDPVDVPIRTDWLYAWDNAMRDRVEGNVDLDLPTYVAEAEVVGFRLELDGQKYGTGIYDVVEHEVSVTIYEQSVPVGA